jgi:hypothetical protein
MEGGSEYITKYNNKINNQKGWFSSLGVENWGNSP